MGIRRKTPKGERFKVLVVDDESSSRDLLKVALAEKGYETQVAPTAREALQRIDRDRPDLVLTDLKMPGLDGMELMRRIRDQSPDTLVILMTGYASLDSAIAAIREGAYDYLTKPFRLEELYIAVKNATDRISLIRENKKLIDQLKNVYREEKGKPTGKSIGSNETSQDLLQALQKQLYQIYTRTGRN